MGATDAIETIRITVLKTDELILTRAQRDLYAELEGETVADLRRFATVLVARVVILMRHRCVHGREPQATLAQAERVYALVAVKPRSSAARAAIWSLVESLTRWAWGAGGLWCHRSAGRGRCHRRRVVA